MGTAALPITSSRALEQVFTVNEVAEMLKLSRDTVVRIFRNKPGVTDWGNPSRKSHRRYATLRISIAALRREMELRRVA